LPIEFPPMTVTSEGSSHVCHFHIDAYGFVS